MSISNALLDSILLAENDALRKYILIAFDRKILYFILLSAEPMNRALVHSGINQTLVAWLQIITSCASRVRYTYIANEYYTLSACFLLPHNVYLLRAEIKSAPFIFLAFQQEHCTAADE